MSDAANTRIDDLLELRHLAHTLGLASHHLVNSAFSGLYASVFRGQGLNFEEVRDYREGDDIRNMDWKVTARTNEPHLKIYREERERSVVLCVDKGPHMHFGTRSTFKYVQAARAAALLGWAANGNHDRVGGIVFGDSEKGVQHYRPTKDRRALWRLLTDLAEPGRQAARGVDSMDSVLQRADKGAGTGALIFVIADFNRDMPGLEHRVGQLCQRHSVVLIPVDDPSDQHLPALGRVLFRDPDGTLLEVETDDPQGREAYHNAWLTRRQNLVRLANRFGVALMAVDTVRDVHLSLREGLARRARSKVRL